MDRTPSPTAGRTASPGTADTHAAGRTPAVGVAPVATTARALTAFCVLLSAVLHLELWALGMSRVDVVGPMFLVNAVAGLALGLAVLLWHHWLPLLGSAGFGAATLLAAVLSVTVGFFGVRETGEGVSFVLAAVSEVGAVVFAVLAWVLEARLRTRRPARP